MFRNLWNWFVGLTKTEKVFIGAAFALALFIVFAPGAKSNDGYVDETPYGFTLGERSDARSMRAFIGHAMEWIAENSEHPLPDSPPSISFYGRLTVCELIMAKDLSTCMGDGVRIWGFYNHRENFMGLDHQFTMNELKHAAILVHELVHYAQDEDPDFVMHFDGDHPCRTESPAYRLMVQWVGEVTGTPGFNATVQLGFNPLWLMQMTSCDSTF